MQYNLEKNDLNDICHAYTNLIKNIPDEVIKAEKIVCALPDTCSLARMDREDLIAIRNTIDRIIKEYDNILTIEELNLEEMEEVEPNGIN